MINRQALMMLVIMATSIFWGNGAPALSQSNFSSDQALSYFQAQDWDQLVRYLNAWIKATPDDPMPWYYLGISYGSKSHSIGMGRPADAKPAFQRALALKPVWPQAWNALGFTDLELKDYTGAATAFERATQQAPSKANYWNNLAAAYSYAGRFSLAVKTLEDEQRAIASTATFVDWYNLGNGFCSMEEFQSAAKAYRQAIKLNPGYGPAWNNLGSLEGVLGNTQAALNDFQRASALGDQLGADNYAKLQRAVALAQQSRNDDPLQAFWKSQAAELEYRAQQAWQARLAAAQTP